MVVAIIPRFYDPISAPISLLSMLVDRRVFYAGDIIKSFKNAVNFLAPETFK